MDANNFGCVCISFYWNYRACIAIVATKLLTMRKATVDQ